MSNDVYRFDEDKGGHLRKLHWWLIAIVAALLVGVALLIGFKHLKPDTMISDSGTVGTGTSSVSTHKYREADFSIDFPQYWTQTSRQPGQTQQYIWQDTSSPSGGAVMTVYEDTDLSSYPLNRLLVVADNNKGGLSLSGKVSPDCKNFTTSPTSIPDQLGVSTTWEGVYFSCDERQQSHTVAGTGSKNGINEVDIKSPSTGRIHKFFFTYITYNSTSPDYTTFYSALNSFKLN